MDWMKDQPLLNSSLNINLMGFNSSSKASFSNASTSFNGIGDQAYYFRWADNQSFITLALPKTEDNKNNIQLPIAGIRAFASCGLNNYSLTQLTQGNGKGSTIVPNLGYDNTPPLPGSSFPYTLKCANNCSSLDNSSVLACSAQSSHVNLTSFDYKNVSGNYVTDLRTGTSVPTDHYTFSNVGSTSPGQVLSCIEQDSTDVQSTAAILLAVQGANNMTQVATCNISVTYMKPTVNTLLGQYIDSTGSSSALSGLNATPVELLNLSMTSFINFFHEGPPVLNYEPASNCTLPPITSGFQWITDWGIPCYSPELPNPVTNESNPAALLKQPYSDFIIGAASFDERMFLGPLASLINDPTFFQSGTVSGVTFKVENGLAYGKVPPVLALVVLALPILWTIALSVITITRRRWTASLDAFAMFKLGADWRDDLQDLRLVSLGKASERMVSIPGTVLVNPETGVVELANAPPRRRLSMNSRRPTWLQQHGLS